MASYDLLSYLGWDFIPKDGKVSVIKHSQKEDGP